MAIPAPDRRAVRPPQSPAPMGCGCPGSAPEVLPWAETEYRAGPVRGQSGNDASPWPILRGNDLDPANQGPLTSSGEGMLRSPAQLAGGYYRAARDGNSVRQSGEDPASGDQ